VERGGRKAAAQMVALAVAVGAGGGWCGGGWVWGNAPVRADHAADAAAWHSDAGANTTADTSPDSHFHTAADINAHFAAHSHADGDVYADTGVEKARPEVSHHNLLDCEGK